MRKSGLTLYHSVTSTTISQQMLASKLLLAITIRQKDNFSDEFKLEPV